MTSVEAFPRSHRRPSAGMRPLAPLPPRAGSPLRVAVLVALFRHAGAGGHVKSWERFADAAADVPGALDLTVHFLGTERSTQVIAPNVRIQCWRPRFSTGNLPFLGDTPGDTDLAPRHPALARALAGADVIHTTDAFFSFTGSAREVARSRGTPLIHSVHTDTPGYARALTETFLARALGSGPAGRLLAGGLDLPGRLEAHLQARLIRHQKEAAFTLVSSANHRAQAEAAVGASRVMPLERGIDFGVFTPGRADRSRRGARHGVPDGRFLIAYVGRLDCCKNVDLFTRAFDANALAAMNAHLLFVGDGPERDRLAGWFGPHATLTGALSQAEVAQVLADADLFLFPSTLEVLANVVRESLAAGTAALISDRGYGSGDVIEGKTGLYLPAGDPAAWRTAVAALAAEPGIPDAMGKAAAAWARRSLPSWADVLSNDLLPVWQTAMAGRTRHAARPVRAA